MACQGSTLHFFSPMYSHIFTYLNFEVENYFITLYVFVYRYKRSDLLVMTTLSTPTRRSRTRVLSHAGPTFKRSNVQVQVDSLAQKY
jgi:hypothetical protein